MLIPVSCCNVNAIVNANTNDYSNVDTDAIANFNANAIVVLTLPLMIRSCDVNTIFIFAY